LAYPDEPQRPLTAGEPTTSSPLRIALALFATALLACIVVYLGASIPGTWFPTASTQTLVARQLALARGTGGLDGDAIAVSAVDPSGIAIVSANTDFRSADYPIIAWNGFGFAENADVRFLWQTDYAPGKLNSAPVAIIAGHPAPLVMSKNPDWVGRVKGIALAIRGPIGEQPRIVGVAAKPGGAIGQFVDRVREWVAFERWSGSSINTITGGAEVQELPLPTLLFVAALIALGAWFAIAWRRHRLAALPAVVAVLFLAAWALLDAQWTANLARQLADTRAQFGGKDWRERHLAMDDGPLFAFIEKARAKMPATPVRVFVVADAAYFRGRGAYHLYPHNVWFDPFRNTLPHASTLRPGDYVLVYHRRGLQYNPEEKKMRIEGSDPVSAEVVLAEPGAVLMKVL
jgi:hypothetical protein